MKKLIFILISVISLQSIKAQDYSWWEQLHGWDGTKHWSEYLIMSPAYLGPHALPVPPTRKGVVPTGSYFQSYIDVYGGHGDQTQSITNELFFSFDGGRVGVEASLMTAEHYKMDEATRDLRKSRDYDGEGYSVGDLYLATFIQLLREKKYLPDLMVSFNLKTASAGNLEGARFTDTPGYFFDLSAGRNFNFAKSGIGLRLYSTFGFYVWQTNEAYYQNDAYSYAAGFDLKYRKISISNSIDGYTGWMYNGDAPQVFRCSVKLHFGKSEPTIMYQYGIRDFPYNSLRFAYKWYFGK